MSYHIVSIDAPQCSLSCRDGQLTFKDAKGDEKQLPLEDIASIIITSFSATIHSQLFLEAAKHGVALILHTLAALKALNFDRYGLVTVLIAPDEEIGSVAERDLIARLGAEHDLVLSCESSPLDESVRLATSGVQLAVLTVKGRASHAGSAPDQGRNAVYELAHQLLQMRDLSNPSRAVKMNWTVVSGGSVPNAIPEDARAIGDMRADDEKDFAAVEAAIRERITNHLIPDTTVAVTFEREVDLGNLSKVQDLMRWCCQQIGGAP